MRYDDIPEEAKLKAFAILDAREKSLTYKQQAYKKRQRDKGLIQVAVWVPPQYGDLIKELAKNVREGTVQVMNTENMKE